MTDLQDAALPEAAMRRLAELGDRQGAIFTSDLSVNEFLLVKEAGSTRWAWCWAARSTTWACRWAGGARTRSSPP